MLAYLAKSVLGAVAVLLVMSFIVFSLQSIIPADPARAVVGPNAPPETVQAMREQLGLDDPVVVQYGRFLWHLAQGDLGDYRRVPCGADGGSFQNFLRSY